MTTAPVRDIGTVKDVHGYVIRVGVDHDAVTIGGATYAVLGPEARDDFAKLYFEAGAEAKAWADANVQESAGGCWADPLSRAERHVLADNLARAAKREFAAGRLRRHGGDIQFARSLDNTGAEFQDLRIDVTERAAVAR